MNSNRIGELINKSATFLDIHKSMDELRKIKRDGFQPGLTTGWLFFDDYFTFPPMGQLSVVTGVPGSGKSEWLDSLAMNMAMKQNWKVFYYSPENYPPSFHLQKLMEKYCGLPAFADYNGQQNIGFAQIDEFEGFLNQHFAVQPGGDHV